MPTAAQFGELNELEDRLFEMFESDKRAIVVAVITTNGMREFVLYATEPDEVSSKYQQLRKCLIIKSSS